MDTSLELRLIEKGFDNSTRTNLTLKEAAERIENKFRNKHNGDVIFFEGRRSTALVNAAGVLIDVDREGPIFVDDGNNGKMLEIYSGEQLLNGKSPIRIPKLCPATIEQLSLTKTQGSLPQIVLDIGEESGDYIVLNIIPETEASAGYFPRLPDGVQRDRVLWKAIAGHLRLNLEEVNKLHRAIYKTTAHPNSPNGIDFIFMPHSDGYVVQAEFAQSKYDAQLRSYFNGLDVSVLKVDGKSSEHVKAINGGEIQKLRVGFPIGKAHHVLAYLQRVLGK